MPQLGFDHDETMAAGRQRLADPRYTTTPVGMLPACFTLRDAQRTFERFKGVLVNKRSCRSWARRNVPIRETGEDRHGRHQLAKLYERPKNEGGQA